MQSFGDGRAVARRRNRAVVNQPGKFLGGPNLIVRGEGVRFVQAAQGDHNHTGGCAGFSHDGDPTALAGVIGGGVTIGCAVLKDDKVTCDFHVILGKQYISAGEA